MKILITGSAGFVGRHLVDEVLDNTNWDIIGLDSFKHGGFSTRVRHHPRYTIITHDLTTPIDDHLCHRIGHIDYVINLASNSHVDYSITDPAPFIANNSAIMSTVLDYCRKVKPTKIIQCSTDEVFGPALHGQSHKEWDNFYPSNPYAASKVAQEATCFSYWRTYGIPIILTRCMNMFMTHQGGEKYIPKIIKHVHHGLELTVHGTPDNIGSRMYLDARNLADAWIYILNNIEPVFYTHDTKKLQRPTAFNIIGDEELTNLELAQMIADIMEKPLVYKFQDFHSVRPGHDFRYALDGSLLRTSGWDPKYNLKQSLKETIDWYLKNPEWLI